jgi:glycine cleavage system H protein
MDFDKTRFSQEHEWVRANDDNDEVFIGITEFAAGELGDIVYVELPDAGAEVTAGNTMGTIEAVKTVADLFVPVSGSIIEVNSALEDQPDLINESPYEKGWFVKLAMKDRAEFEKLMTHDAYQEMIGKA